MKQLIFLILFSSISFLHTVQQNTEYTVDQTQNESLYYLAVTHPTDNHRFNLFELSEDYPDGFRNTYVMMQNSRITFRYQGYNVRLARAESLSVDIANLEIVRYIKAQISNRR